MIKTTNLEWGFYGTLKSKYGLSDKEAEVLYDHAAKTLMIARSMSQSQAVELLDSRTGRHFADHLSFFNFHKLRSQSKRAQTIESQVLFLK